MSSLPPIYECVPCQPVYQYSPASYMPAQPASDDKSPGSPQMILVSPAQLMAYPMALCFSSPLSSTGYPKLAQPGHTDLDHTDLSIIDYSVNPCSDTTLTEPSSNQSFLSLGNTSGMGSLTYLEPYQHAYGPYYAFQNQMPSSAGVDYGSNDLAPLYETQHCSEEEHHDDEANAELPKTPTCEIQAAEDEIPAQETIAAKVVQPLSQSSAVPVLDRPSIISEPSSDDFSDHLDGESSDSDFIYGSRRKRKPIRANTARKARKMDPAKAPLPKNRRQKPAQPKLRPAEPNSLDTTQFYTVTQRKGKIVPPVQAELSDELRVKTAHSHPELRKELGKKVRGVITCGVNCGEVFSDCQRMLLHLDAAHERSYRKFQCPERDCVWSVLGFHKSSEYLRHYRSQHCGPTYECAVPHCGKSFRRSDSCQRHVKMSHLNPCSRFNSRKSARGGH